MSLAEKTLLLSFAPALAAAVLALGLDAFGLRRSALWLCVVGLLGSMGASAWGAATLKVTNGWGAFAVGGAFSAVGAVVFVVGIASVAGGSDWLSERPHGGSWAALLTIAAVASVAAATALDLVTLLIALETVAACSYALVTASRDRRGDEAALKYFVQGSVATGLFVVALGPLVGIFAADGGYATLGKALAAAPSLAPGLLGCVLLTSVLAFKAGAVPFHSWAPDAYGSAPPAVSAFLATGPKLAAVGAIAMAVLALASTPVAHGVSVVLAVLAVLSVIVGSVAALGQRDYTRMLGYAGVAQVGYALVALAAGFAPAALLFTATYAVGSGAAFMAAAAFRRVRPDWDGSIDGLAGFGRRLPLVAVPLALALVSLAGVPPLLGFWGKFWAFGAAVQNGYLWLALVAIAGSVVSVAYYGSVLRALFLEPEPSHREAAETPGRFGGSAGVAVVHLGVAAVLLGFAPLVWGIGTLLSPFLVGG